MDTAVINFRTNASVKSQFQKVADELGLGVSAILNALVRQVIRTKKVEVEVRPEIPNSYLRKMLKGSAEDFKKGDFYSFDDPKEAIKFLDKI